MVVLFKAIGEFEAFSNCFIAECGGGQSKEPHLYRPTAVDPCQFLKTCLLKVGINVSEIGVEDPALGGNEVKDGSEHNADPPKSEFRKDSD
jgi:hypothetical protein